MKIWGLIFVFISSSAYGFIKAKSYRDTELELHSFISLVSFIKREISLYLTPQSKIYEKFDDQILEKNGFLEQLRQYSASSMELPMYHAVSDFRSTKLPEKAVEILKEFGHSLGTLSIDEECKRCDATVTELEELYKISKEETVEKTRLCRSVGIMIGIGLVLLLW